MRRNAKYVTASRPNFCSIHSSFVLNNGGIQSSNPLFSFSGCLPGGEYLTLGAYTIELFGLNTEKTKRTATENMVEAATEMPTAFGRTSC